MTGDLLAHLPARQGHFVLESGYHTDLWLTLDALFVDPCAIAPLIAALAARLHPHEVTAVCGPLLGGAFLAHALAAELGARFYFTERAPSGSAPGLFSAEYRLPPALQGRARGERIAVVDDVISAGSSVRATAAALASSGAETVVAGALLVLGSAAVEHFAAQGLPLEALGRREFSHWPPDECPLCRSGMPLEDPTR